jgi:hypothetical protein
LEPVTAKRLAANLAGQINTTCFTDTDSAGLGPLFYRVGVDQ